MLYSPQILFPSPSFCLATIFRPNSHTSRLQIKLAPLQATLAFKGRVTIRVLTLSGQGRHSSFFRASTSVQWTDKSQTSHQQEAPLQSREELKRHGKSVEEINDIIQNLPSIEVSQIEICTFDIWLINLRTNLAHSKLGELSTAHNHAWKKTTSD